ncbi:autotransporter outer membrane beta-barrel domain-containing protein [Falsochrobactrum shanghaiense]|nr:autotransporter outer membrane beta-barrel domain-containing protein [Falsochrobactrum shanghaiense]
MRGVARVTSGSDNHLILAGETSDTFNFGLLDGIATVPESRKLGGYVGFADFTKNGTSTWSGGGISKATGPWMINEGTLALTGDGSLASHQSVTVDATLDISGIDDTTTMKNVSGNANGRIILGGKALALQADTPQTFAGIASGDGGGVNILSGTQIFTGNNIYTGTTGIAAGAKLQLGDGGTSGTVAGTVAVDGTLSFDRSDIWSFGATLQGPGMIAQNGSGKTRLNGNGSGFTGIAAINKGGLIVNGTLGGSVDLQAGRLEGTGTVGSVTSTAHGTIAPGDGGLGTLTIKGNYTVSGGIVEIASALAADNSPTSRLAVTGNTSGTGKVHVTNRGGVGAQTAAGIEIISVGGQSNAVFALQSDFTTKDGRPAIVAGAYSYSLYKGQPTQADGNWYLRSELTNQPNPPTPPTPPTPPVPPAPQPHYNPATPVYEGAAQSMKLLNRLPSLQQRVGNRHWGGAANRAMVQGDGPGWMEGAPSPDLGAAIDSNGIWARIEGGYSHLRPQSSTTNMRQNIDTALFQAGIDGLFHEGENGRLIGGMSGHYGKANSDVVSPHGDGKTDIEAWGLGATLTWYGESGIYLDGQAHVNWFRSDYHSTTANRELASGQDAFGYAISVETGQRIVFDPYWSVTPQAQLLWSSIDAESFRDTWDTTVRMKDGNSLTGRLGASLDYRNSWYSNEGQLSRVSAYAIANVYQDFLRGTSVHVADTRFRTQQDRTWAGLGLGGTYAWNDDKYAVYGEGAVNTSLNNFAKSYDLKGTIGFRVKW